MTRPNSISEKKVISQPPEKPPARKEVQGQAYPSDTYLTSSAGNASSLFPFRMPLIAMGTDTKSVNSEDLLRNITDESKEAVEDIAAETPDLFASSGFKDLFLKNMIIDRLLDLIKGDSVDIRKAALEALASIDDLSDVLYMKIGMLDANRPAEVVSLIENDNVDVSLAAMDAVRRYVNSGAATKPKLIKKAYDCALRRSSDKNNNISSAATTLSKKLGTDILRRGDAYAFNQLMTFYHLGGNSVNDNIVEVMRCLCDGLMYLEDTKTATTIIRGLSGDINGLISGLRADNAEGIEARKDALICLGKVLASYGNHSIDRNLGYVLKNRHAERLMVRQNAAFILANIGTEASISVLINALQYGVNGDEINKTLVNFIIRTKGADALKHVLWAFQRGILDTYDYKMWEGISDILSQPSDASSNTNLRPLIRGNRVVFPRGVLPQNAREIVVRAHRKVLHSPEPKEVTFVFDCSGSMKDRLIEDDPSGLTKFDQLKQAFTELVRILPGHDEVTYKLNAFGPKNSAEEQEAGPSFEVIGTGADKESLIGYLENMEPKGATLIWANTRHAVDHAQENGVIIIYSDGRSDISFRKKNGKPEYEEKTKQDIKLFDEFKRNLMRDIEDKNLKVHIICGTEEAAHYLRPFADMSKSIELSKATNEGDIGRIMKDVATTKTMSLGKVQYGIYVKDDRGNVIREFRRAPIGSLDHGKAIEVVNGISLDKRNGNLQIRDIVARDNLGRTNEIGLDKFTISRDGEYAFDEASMTLAKGSASPPVITLNLDTSSSMVETVPIGRKEYTKLDLLKGSSRRFSANMMQKNVRVQINAFSDWEWNIESYGTNVDNIIAGLRAGGGTRLRENLLISILATPRGGSVVTFTDGNIVTCNITNEPQENECYADFGDEVVSMAMARGVRLYFIQSEKDISHIKVLSHEKYGWNYRDPRLIEKFKGAHSNGLGMLYKAAMETGGGFVSFKDYSKITLAFDQIAEGIKREHPEVSLPLPKAKEIIIPISTQDGEVLLRMPLP